MLEEKIEIALSGTEMEVKRDFARALYFIADVLPILERTSTNDHFQDGVDSKQNRHIDLLIARGKELIDGLSKPQNWPDSPGRWWFKNGNETIPIEVGEHPESKWLYFFNLRQDFYWEFTPDKEPKAGVSFLKMHIPEF